MNRVSRIIRTRTVIAALALLTAGTRLAAWTPKPVVDDPLLRMPGSQQGTVTTLEDAGNCMRCHYPMGWLGGRSDPPNASLMTGGDYDGVQCDFCHRLVDPFFDATLTGQREGSDWQGYWDEAGVVTPNSATQATNCWTLDAGLSTGFTHFNGSPFYGLDNRPVNSNYIEATSPA